MAASMADLTVYNMPPSPPNWDKVGVFYIAFCITWTTLLVAGMIFCAINHRIPILRVRGLPLSFSAILLLHVYWILGQITYPIGATMPTVLAYDVQYFGMGVYFPLGIALFQASNLRFLHVARTQKQQFASSDNRIGRKCNGGDSSWLCRLRNMDYMKRTMTFITIGMIVQVCIAFRFLTKMLTKLSLSSPSVCGSLVRSTTLPMVFQEPKFPRAFSCPNRSFISVEDGSGGHLCSGKSSGLGS